MLAFLVIALIAGSTNFAVIGNALSENTWQYPIATVIAITAAFFAVFIEMGKIPFDLAEAEQELQEGPLTEYSGPALALLKVGLSLKSMVVASIFVSVLLPFGIPTEMSLSAVILGGVLFFVKLFVVFVLACVFENTLSRTRFMLTGRLTVVGILPFVGAFIVGLNKKHFAQIATVFAALATLGTMLVAGQWFANGHQSVTYDIVAFDKTAIFGVTLDAVSTLIAFAVVALGFLICLYSCGYLTDKNREHPHNGLPRFYAFLLIFIGAMAGLVYSSTLAGQLLFFEITGGCSWALISYYQTPKAQAAAMKALIITHVGAIGLYIAAAYLFSQSGTFSITALEHLDPSAKTIVLFGVMFAAWGKSAQLPMQIWLPNAMEAPTPVSAYLHAASMVKVGVYIFARSVMSAGEIPHIVGEVGIIMAMITLIYGFLMYLPQTDLKRLLAYSTITQLSYIFIGISLAALGSKLAFVAAISYIFNHAFAKSLFFLVAGSLSYATGTRSMPLLRGIMRTMPVVGAGFGVAALAIAGVPPFNGFFSKYPLFAAGFELGQEYGWITWLMVLALVESTATFVWLLYKFGQCVIGKPSEVVANAQPIPFSMRFVLVVLMVMSVVSSFIAAYWLGLAG